MDFFSKQRITAWLIIVLIICNLGTLSILWITRIHPPGSSRPGTGGPPVHARDFLSRELNFSDEQKQDLAELQSDQIVQVDALQKEIDNLKRRMMDELLKASPGNDRIDELAAAVGKLEESKARLVFIHLEEIKGLCNPEQRERFDGLVRELLRIMKPPGQHAAHPPSRGSAYHQGGE